MLSYFKNKLLLLFHKSLYKPGHYYSPIPNLTEIRLKENQIFQQTGNINDIQLNTENQHALLENLKEFHTDFSFPEENSHEYRYFSNNPFFIRSDAYFLYSFMRYFKPKQIIEIGSGFSSALMLDVNRKFLSESIELSFIEPFPDRLYSLIGNDLENKNIIVSKVQDVPLEFFDTLDKNDILFIDSSHISKIGSDVNHIIFTILPRLKSGVIIHFHDITWPFEYPKDWIYEGRFWNEAYLLRAFLMNNSSYEILLFNNYLAQNYAGWLAENLPLACGGGGSFYMVKK